MADSGIAFDYSNLSGRPPGPLLRAGMIVSRGIRAVQRQVGPYADRWQRSNAQTLSATGSLWVVLGDSMSQGVGASDYDKGWVGQVRDSLAARGTPYRILNLSTSGARVRDVLDRQLPALEKLGVKPDLVTVLIGSNDMARAKYRRAMGNDFKMLLDKLPDHAVVANLPGAHGVARTISALIAADRSIVLADMQAQQSTSWRGKLAADHFHPNDAGYQGMARVFGAAIDHRRRLES